jgi:hypothetical protein
LAAPGGDVDLEGGGGEGQLADAGQGLASSQVAALGGGGAPFPMLGAGKEDGTAGGGDVLYHPEYPTLGVGPGGTLVAVWQGDAYETQEPRLFMAMGNPASSATKHGCISMSRGRTLKFGGARG